MGSLFLRTRRSHGRIERRWVAMVRMPDGKRPSAACPHQHAPADRACPEAQAALADLLRVRDGLAPADLRTLSVGAYLLRWAAMLTDLAPATIRQHEMIVRVHLAPAFPGLLTTLRPSDVNAYLARRHRDPQTLRHHRATLRRALADAVRDGYIATNPAGLSRAPRMRKAERRYLSAAEARRLIDTSRGERLWPLWTLLVSTGLRLSEALGLAWSDVEMGGNDATHAQSDHPRADSTRGDARVGRPASERASLSSLRPYGGGNEGAPRPGALSGSLTVRHQLVRVGGEWHTDEPKTEKSRRTIVLIPQAIEALREQRTRQDAERGSHPRPIDGLVFTTAAGEPLHGTNVLPPFRRALRAAGLPQVTLHDLRHSCATILLGAGVPLPVIADILGHSSIRVTADLYAHVIPELRHDAAERLAGALG